jgi:hypothetical protein
MLASCVVGDGNLLLNVGPMPDGRIDPEQAKRLAEIGEWVKVNEAGVYGTRGGPYKSGAWGGSSYKGNKIYLHLFDFYDGEHVFPLLPVKVLKSRALNGAKVDLVINEKSMHIRVPEKERDPNCTVVELEIEGEAKDLALIEMPKKPYAFELKYGKWLSGALKADYELSTVSTFRGDVSNRWMNEHKRRYLLTDGGKQCSIATDPESSPYVIVDIVKVANIKRVEVFNSRNKQGTPNPLNKNLRIWVSEDKENWKEVYRDEECREKWEVEPTRFSAGIDLPGVKGRYVKVGVDFEKPERLRLLWVKVYGETGE